MSADTKIRVASLSKVVLAMIVMQLSDLGQLDIDADIGEYWSLRRDKRAYLRENANYVTNTSLKCNIGG